MKETNYQITEFQEKLKIFLENKKIKIFIELQKLTFTKFHKESIEYVCKHSDVEFIHGFCPECMKIFYPEVVAEDEISP